MPRYDRLDYRMLVLEWLRLPLVVPLRAIAGLLFILGLDQTAAVLNRILRRLGS